MDSKSHAAEQPGLPLSRTREGGGSQGGAYPPLTEESRELVPTDCAAYHLNRRPQTLREWACLENGLLRPVRIGSRLGWRTADLRRILKGGRDEA
jgi:hypothetical protein